MNHDYLIVSKEILPEYFSRVVEARILLESSQCRSVSEAVKKVGISRSTYYKYREHIFYPSGEFGHRFTISLILDDETGILSDVLLVLCKHQANIITIHQDIPINNAAIVILTLDGKKLLNSVEDLMDDIKKLQGVYNVKLVAME